MNLNHLNFDPQILREAPYTVSFFYITLRALLVIGFFSILAFFLNKRFGVISNPPSKKQKKTEWVANLKTNLFEIFFMGALLSSNLWAIHEFSWSRFFLTFVFCYLFFELWFYGMHRLMHSTGLRRIHKTHHASVYTNPLSALCLSIPEKVSNDIGLLLVPLLATRLHSAFIVEGVIAYHFYNFVVNVLGHSNLELLPKWYTRSFIGKIFVSSTYHSMHHLKGQVHFGLFTSLFDRLFGTFDPSYERSFQKVKSQKSVDHREFIKLGEHHGKA
jgi:sterol desaturase/sphingolipid hydroxylase (fatty acid hydroxylase superfamily)